ncbi:hypothetical protein Brsp07_04616 [Brucella sp. NBRC 14130]|uniref:hypothetical protein n=1 Tax=Brucella sp. NBRC 14130 TaxID=3075483 RepID=UPI00309F2D9A
MNTTLDYWLRYSGLVMSGMLALARFLCDHFPLPMAVAITCSLPIALYFSVPFVLFKLIAVAILAPFFTYLVIGLSSSA